MNRIEKRMQELQQRGEKALITYMTAGLPDMEGTKKLIRAQEEAGVDVLELGIPFSAPVADGPVIQDASYRSILKGTTLRKVLAKFAEVELLVQIGEYKKGSDKEADDALARINAVNAFLRQGLDEKSTFEETLQALYKVVA